MVIRAKSPPICITLRTRSRIEFLPCALTDLAKAWLALEGISVIPRLRAAMRYRLTISPSKRLSDWIALFAVICTVSLYSIEATHFHHTLAEQLNCPAGHAVGHSPANVYIPAVAAELAAYGPVEFKVIPVITGSIGNPAYFIPQSHAPPSFAS